MRFFVYAGDYYYPSGGHEDFVQETDNFDYAKGIADEATREGSRWAQVVEVSNAPLMAYQTLVRYGEEAKNFEFPGPWQG